MGDLKTPTFPSEINWPLKTRRKNRALPNREQNVVKNETLTMNSMSLEEFLPWLENTDYKGPIGITSKWYVKADKVSKFCQIMNGHVAFVNSQIGVRLYKLHSDFKNPLAFWQFEEWDSVRDLKNLCSSETYIKNEELLQDTLGEPVLHIGLYKIN